MNAHKWKRDEHHASHKNGVSIGLLILMVIVIAVLWQHNTGWETVQVNSVGGLIGSIFGLIGSVIGAVFGLIGHIIGLVFGVIGIVLGLVGAVIGLVLGFVGLVLGLVFGILGFVLSVVVPLAVIVVVIKMVSGGKSNQAEKQKRKNDWNDDEIVNI